MATADIWRSGGSGRLMEEASGCGAATTERNGAVSLRRRRMEIRRIKTMANASAANVIVEQPVSKRLRPVSSGGGGGGGSNVVVREEVVVEGGGDGGEVMDNGLCETGNPEDNASRVCDERFSVEWGQESSAKHRRSVCEVIREGGEAEAEAAASSLSQAWERPFGGVLAPCEGNGCVDHASEIVGNHLGDRMSSGGSNSSGQESDESSTLTLAEGLQSTLGNDTVPAQECPQALAAGPHSPGAQQSSQILAAGPPSSGTADMAASTVTETLTTGHVDNQSVDMSGVHPEHTSPWQVSGNESTLDSSAVVAGDAGGSSAPSDCFASNACPPHGMVSVCGRRREMEDAVVSEDSFMKLPCNKVGGCDALGVEATPLHYFGVYDGHGGSQAANFCADRLHQALAEEVESCFVQGQNVDQNSTDWESKWLTAMTQCFKRMDAEVGGFCLEEGDCQADNSRCCPEPIAPETVGTTAIVAVVGACQIIVGNCGDSRAVLSRGGVAIPLSVDHKPEREDEMARVEAAGGRVIYWNGYRVLGVLAMSRAIGDRYLKPYVIAEPEVKCVKRADDDECLILASDGLWDVMSNEVVCDIARRALNCRRNGQPPDASQSSSSEEETPAQQAAALLVKLALAKGSSDNISVVVVDLKVNR